MANSNQDEEVPSIYIVGAQCTGKTTLADALYTRILQAHVNLPVSVIKEVARNGLKSQNITRDDIRSGSERAMCFQDSILEAQWQEELNCDTSRMVISDRSGIDPIVFASKFDPQDHAKAMLESRAWEELGERMRHAIVIVCEPVTSWLVDNGVRLMPESTEELLEIHQLFCKLLQNVSIDFRVLPASITHVQDRVDFVLCCWRNYK